MELKEILGHIYLSLILLWNGNMLFYFSWADKCEKRLQQKTGECYLAKLSKFNFDFCHVNMFNWPVYFKRVNKYIENL